MNHCREINVEAKQILAAYYAVGSLVVLVLAVPLYLGRVPRNAWYGMRIPKTMASDHAWYLANRYLGRMLLRAGSCALLGSLALMQAAPYLSMDALAWLGLAVTVGPLAAAILASLLYTRDL